MKSISANLNVIIKACEKASKSLIRDFGEIENLQVSIKGPSDFVSSADKKVEKTLIKELEKARPDYSFLSEEIGKIDKKNKNYRWIIDPIDGTLNFLHGIPHFAISVALEKEKEIVCGVIYDPIKDELFFAEKNQGAFLNNQKIRVSKRKTIKDCMLFTGGPSSKSNNKQISLQEYEKISNTITSPLRKMGSAALDMAYIAAGRADGFFQRNLNYWDIAAGLIIIREAGGIISDFSGTKEFVEKKNIIATNSYINKDLINLLKT
jgi:myo-inositol-1(or 4)-monophosphatase